MNNFYQMNPNGGICGGYPNGYPSNISQNGFPQNQMEVTLSNGMTVYPNQNNQQTGDMRFSPGGFNPVTGTISQPTMVGGFNPYAQVQQNPYVQQQVQQGFGVYDPTRQYYSQQNFYGVYSPFSQLCNPYGQNEFNNQIQQFLYNYEIDDREVKSLLENVVLTEEERNKINSRRSSQMIIGRDYYGRPIYNNNSNYVYQQNQELQQELEKVRRNYQEVCVKLSKIAHSYFGETIDEEAAMRLYDPVPQRQQIQQPVPFNYYTATDQEKQQYEKMATIMNTSQLSYRMNQREQQEQYFQQLKGQLFDKIKTSYDELIGIKPGEKWDMVKYFDNAYKVLNNINFNKCRSSNRNGTTKYSRSEFRANLSQNTQSPVPILSSKDDEYLSIEDALKSVYDKNKKSMNINTVMRNPNGQTSFGQLPCSELGSEYEAHKRFMEAVQKKHIDDEARKSVL